jgi:peptidoglycan/xylan/chitin deacetylase (PgdA/CDA1 family)
MNNDFMLYPNFKVKALTFSYDDGVKEDRPFVALLNKYGLKGTFNLNSGLMAKEKKMDDKICPEEIPDLYKGHEVAVHTVHHPFLEKILP